MKKNIYPISKYPYAWALYLYVATLCYILAYIFFHFANPGICLECPPRIPWPEWPVYVALFFGIILTLLWSMQVAYNVQDLLDKKPKFNTKKFLLSILLLLPFVTVVAI